MTRVGGHAYTDAHYFPYGQRIEHIDLRVPTGEVKAVRIQVVSGVHDVAMSIGWLVRTRNDDAKQFAFARTLHATDIQGSWCGGGSISTCCVFGVGLAMRFVEWLEDGVRIAPSTPMVSDDIFVAATLFTSGKWDLEYFTEGVPEPLLDCVEEFTQSTDVICVSQGKKNPMTVTSQLDNELPANGQMVLERGHIDADRRRGRVLSDWDVMARPMLVNAQHETISWENQEPVAAIPDAVLTTQISANVPLGEVITGRGACSFGLSALTSQDDKSVSMGYSFTNQSDTPFSRKWFESNGVAHYSEPQRRSYFAVPVGWDNDVVHMHAASRLVATWGVSFWFAPERIRAKRKDHVAGAMR